MKISFAAAKPAAAGHAVCMVYEKGKNPVTTQAMDKQTGGLIIKALKDGRFTGKKGQFKQLVPSGKSWQSIVLAGLGDGKELTTTDIQNLGGGLVKALNGYGVKQAIVTIEAWQGNSLSTAEMAAQLAFGARLAAYRFDKYHTTMEADKKPTLTGLTLVVENPKAAQKAYAALDALADGICLTRDLVTEPANVINPESLARECKKLEKYGITVETLGEKEMKKLGMGALLGVGQGSAFESKLVVMQYRGAKNAKDKPLAFVGKGVCFDSGGISIKPAGGMEDMKWDMGGAGVVIGLMRALAGRKAKINAVGVVGLVENMPSGTAQRPGDVVTSMSGQTIEVINTDAEGRLVLADALWYTQDRFKPRFMVNLATLTGAIIIALGSQRAGLFSNDDELADRLFNCGKEEGEPIWRFPLGKEYDKQIDSDIADMKNVGEGREAGSITAAQFLQRFVNDVPWAHLDIAGVTWSKKDKDTVPKGGTGFGVRLLNRLVAEYYE